MEVGLELENGKKWKNFEVHDLKSLGCFELLVEIQSSNNLTLSMQKEVGNIVEGTPKDGGRRVNIRAVQCGKN